MLLQHLPCPRVHGVEDTHLHLQASISFRHLATAKLEEVASEDGLIFALKACGSMDIVLVVIYLAEVYIFDLV